jgi:TolB-like protein/Tfp pilus assembly protein PilF
MKSLVQEIRARHLDRIGATYAVVGWILVQGASILLPTFNAPASVLRGFIIALIVCFPVVLTAAAIFVPRSIEAPEKSTTAFATLLGLGLLAAILLTGVGYFLYRTGGAPVGSGPPANSIAVLPFANLSGDPNRRYLSDGVSDELITDLARLPSLRVAARSSSFALANKNVDAKAAARILNVRAVLEGSVREAGDRVRISAELVNGADGFQMWSESYDRQESDILQLQDEIARAVTSALSAKLLNRMPRATSISPDAYRLYLQGKFFSARDNEEDLKHANDLLARAAKLAPNYAAIFAEAASAQLEMAEIFGRQQWLQPAEEGSRKALAIDPGNLHALTVLAEVQIDKWNWQAALDLLRKARAVNPNNIYVLHLQSVLATIFQFPQESLAAERSAAKLDPLSFGLKFNIAQWYDRMGRYREAEIAIGEAAKLQPTNIDARSMRCLIAVHSGRLAEAQRLASQLRPALAKDPQNFADCPFAVAMADHKPAEARKLIEGAAKDFLANGGYATPIGDSYRKLRDFAEAMKWYERAYTLREILLLDVPFQREKTPGFLATKAWKELWGRPPIRRWEKTRAEIAPQFQRGE